MIFDYLWHWYHLTKHYSGIDGGEDVEEFIGTFEQCIIEDARAADSVGIYLTGGADSRAILAVLLSNDVQPTAITYPRVNDAEIAASLAESYGFDHIRSGFGDAESGNRSEQFHQTHEKYAPSFDVIFSGTFMDEIWGVFDFGRRKQYNKALRKSVISMVYDARNEGDCLTCPAVDGDVVEALFNVNDYYLKEKRLQKEIIEAFEPSLLDEEFNSLVPVTARYRSMVEDMVWGRLRFG